MKPTVTTSGILRQSLNLTQYEYKMIQVDVFWSFAMGACFAACAADGLKRSDSPIVNKYFVYTVIFLAVIFGPSGVYLLWQHTGWETMFMLDRSLHGIWTALFASTNVTQGILGFLLAYRYIRAGRELSAHTLWVVSYCCMFAILLFGYDRFFYAGTSEEWNQNVEYDIVNFFTSEIFGTLCCMAVFVLPPIYYAMVNWLSEFGISRTKKSTIIYHSIRTYIICSIVFSCAYIIVSFISGGEIQQVHLGMHRLLAYVIGQLVFSLTLFLPFLFVRVGNRKRP